MPNIAGQTTLDEAYSALMATTAAASEAMGRAIGNSSNLMDKGVADSLAYLESATTEGQAFLTPYRVAGEQSVGTLNRLLGVNGGGAQKVALQNIINPALQAMQSFGSNVANSAMSSFMTNMGYNPADMGSLVNQVTNNPLVTSMMDYLQQQGSQAAQNSAAAKGMLNSGRTMQELQTQGQGLAATNVMPIVNNLINQTTGALSGIATAGANATIQGGAQLAGTAISNVQSGLSNLVNQGNQAAQAQAQLSGARGQTGSGYKYGGAQFKANNELLRGKVESDALNAIGLLQFQQDMGPYYNSIGTPPQAGGGTSVTQPFMGGGGTGSGLPSYSYAGPFGQSYSSTTGQTDGSSYQSPSYF